MHGNLPAQAQGDIFPGVISDRNGSFVGNSDNGLPFAVTTDKGLGPQWFSDLCRYLWPSKASAALEHLTSAKGRSSYRYASGEIEPPAHVVVELLRSPEGERAYDWIMRGSKEKFDIQRRRARRLVAHDDKAAMERRQLDLALE